MERTTFEQAIEVVNSLPTDDRERFNQWFKEQEHLDTKANGAPSIKFSSQPSPMTLEKREARFQRALRWLEENKAKYLGQWVALDGDRLLAAGADGKQVYAKAIAAGVAVPLLHQINLEFYS
ncbi:MAG: hypothetical protein JNM09_31355 [Blastocatellia bacterium]|nr:hypothetical protein [Blastocatellia bacterium]